MGFDTPSFLASLDGRDRESLRDARRSFSEASGTLLLRLRAIERSVSSSLLSERRGVIGLIELYDVVGLKAEGYGLDVVDVFGVGTHGGSTLGVYPP